jgi:hypothetical protein
MKDKTTHRQHTVIKARVDDMTRIRFQGLAKNIGKTESELLREIIAIAIDRNISKEPELVMPDSGNTHTIKFTIRLPAFLVGAVNERAKAHGMATSRWMACLVQSNVMNIPVMTSEELRALDRCSAEMAAIGRNLNQVTRSLNADIRESDKLKLELIHVVLASVVEAQQSIRTLSRVSNQRWKGL